MLFVFIFKAIDLPPQPAGDGHRITISDGETVLQLDDIAFGDVYLCAGQSNMEMTVPAVFNAAAEIEDSINYPNLRLLSVARKTADTPQVDAPLRADYAWGRSGPHQINGTDAFNFFSATCYFFGRELYTSLDGKIPIGLVSSTWGGQRVEAFSSKDAISDTSCGGIHPGLDPNTRPPIKFDVANTQLWNGMIHPLVPMRFLGVIWYQGEANDDDPVSYACRFPAMISDWRQKFDLPDLSFFYVQLAGYAPGKTWPYLRAAQDAALQLPRVGLAAAIDLADPDSPNGAIHPRRKQEVGRRLSLTARAIQYEERGDLIHTGPILSGVHLSVSTEGSHRRTATLSFVPGTADRLHLQGTAACTTCCSEAPFEIMNASGNWTRVAEARVREDVEEIVIVAGSIQPIWGIRYVWEPKPECALYNGHCGADCHSALPAAPFEWCAYPSGKGTWTGESCKMGQAYSSRKSSE